MKQHKEPAPKLGRPALDENDPTVKKSVILTEGMMKSIQSRIEAFGDLSKYVRHLINKDLGRK